MEGWPYLCPALISVNFSLIALWSQCTFMYYTILPSSLSCMRDACQARSCNMYLPGHAMQQTYEALVTSTAADYTFSYRPTCWNGSLAYVRRTPGGAGTPAFFAASRISPARSAQAGPGKWLGWLRSCSLTKAPVSGRRSMGQGARDVQQVGGASTMAIARQ